MQVVNILVPASLSLPTCRQMTDCQPSQSPPSPPAGHAPLQSGDIGLVQQVGKLVSQPGGGETAPSRMVREQKDIKCTPQNSSYSTA